MSKRILAVFLLAAFLVPSVSARMTAKSVMTEAAKKNSVSESISYLKKNVPQLATAADKRSGYAFLGSVQEQAGQYSDAQKSYSLAAAIEAGDADGMPKKSSEQLVLDAVRCALSVGDWESADSYLNSAVKKSKDKRIIAYVNLYAQWSALCRAETALDVSSSVEKLKEYSGDPDMKVVAPSVLLTLHHITGDVSYAAALRSEFPQSLEAGIVSGHITQMPTPFWYFVPRAGFVDVTPGDGESGGKARNSVRKKYQIGFFKEQKNADALVERLRALGFSAKIEFETRSSGTTYRLVYIEENDEGTVGSLLKDAGFDCYPVE